ncbi:MAG: acyl carrier protein, partial [Promethearchaeota archaeon]
MEKILLDIINKLREKKELKRLDSISGDQNLMGDLGFDSFDLAELTVRIEDEFGVDIFEDG